jgi:tetratricopeptide (TPR) repeat protein
MKRRKKIEITVLASLFIVAYGILAALTLVQVKDWRVAKAQEYLHRANNDTIDSSKLVLYEKAAVLDPQEETYLAAGVLALNLGDNILAGKYLNRVKTAEGYHQLGNAYYNLDRYESSIHFFQKSLNLRAEAEVYLRLAQGCLKLGDVDKARTALENSERLNSSQEAVDLLRALAIDIDEIDPGNKAVISYNTLVTLGYPQSAKAVLWRANDKEHVTRESLIALGNEQIQHGNHMAAYELYQKARVIDPYYPQIYEQLVIICKKLGKDDEMKKYQEFLGNIIF